MKCRIFTLLFAFLAIAGNAVWGQNGSAESPVTIDISFMRTGGTTTLPTGGGFTATKGTTSGTRDSDQSNTLTITGGGYYKLTGGNSNIQIKVTATEPVYITLASGIHVDASLDNDLKNPLQDATAGIWENRCAMEIASGANVTLDWEGDCELSSGGLRAGINVKPNATLILKGTGNGKLYGTCWNNQGGIYTSGAGIGGDSEEPNFGTIIIESGTVEGRCLAQVPNWKSYGAGIGGGFKQGTPDPVENGTSSTSGTIIIKEGNVTGTANYDNTSLNIHTTGRSAAIGGGYAGTCTNIAILGGSLTTNTGSESDKIGVGEDYEGNNGITNGIIIGQWDENTTAPNVNISDINQTNYVDGRGEYPSVTGNVTMPERTQIYVPNAPVVPSTDDTDATFYAYNLYLSNEKMEGDSDHKLDEGEQEYNAVSSYYFGKNMTFNLTELGCTEDHLFMGWISTDNSDIVPAKNGNATFETPSENPNGSKESAGVELLYYRSVWVDNEMDVTVRIGTTWAGQPGDHTPEVEYVPTNLDVSNLTFSLSTYDNSTTKPSEFEDLKFVGNQLQGKVNLQGDDTYKKIVIKAKVKLGNDGEEKETTINVVIVDEYMINTASVDLNKKHVYNGQLHNGTSGTEMDDWVLDVKMTKDIIDEPLDEPAPLREGTHYRIYQYTYNNNETPETASDGDEETLPIKNAGTYSNITIQAINDALFDFTLDPQHTGKYTLTGTDQVITVAQREMNVLLKAEVTTVDELNQLKESNDIKSLVNFEAMEGIRGLVEGEEPEISGTISSVEKKEGSDNIYLVTIERSSFKIGKNDSFLPSNYKMTVGSETLTDEGKMPENSDEDIVIEVEISGNNNNDDTDRPGHIERPAKYYNIYIDTVCPGLKLELSKDVVKEGGQVSVYLTIDAKCDTTDFRFEYKKDLFGRWEDLKPLEGVQPGEYIIKLIYHDIYIRALDATMPEEEPTGIEDVEGVKVYAQDGNIYVYTPNRERVMIVSMNGALVKNAEQEGMQSYSVSRGIYIVRIGDKVFKIKN